MNITRNSLAYYRAGGGLKSFFIKMGIIAFVLCSGPSQGQLNSYHMRTSSYPPHDGNNDLSSFYIQKFGYYEHNDCRRFLKNYAKYPYLDTLHYIDVKFKSVTVYQYFSKDSIPTNKKLHSRAVYSFNKMGGITLILRYDTLNKLSDSTAISYDSWGNRVRISDYDKNISLYKMQMRNDELFTWDSKDRMIRDSDIEKKHIVTQYDTSQYNINLITYTYDDSGNVIYQRSINNDDTIIEYNSYDSKNHTIATKTYQYMRWTYHTYKYDLNGNELNNTSIFDNSDTNSIVSVYDAANRKISREKLHNNRLTEIETNFYNPDSSYSQTSETLGDNTGPSCPEDVKNVWLFNTHHDCYSNIKTEESNGKLLTTSTLNKLIYNKLGKMLSDTDIVTGKSQWHWDKTVTIYTYKYDVKGNRIEFSTSGGVSPNSNSRITDVYNDKNNILREDEYASCADKPYKTIITNYFKDGKTVKEETFIRGLTNTTNKYGKDTRYLEKTETDKYGYKQWVWEYTEW